jgi:hypothetical protein
MPEVWENPFANALLKIDRANKHISDIEQRLRTSANRYGPSLHIDGKTGEQFLCCYFTDETLISDLAPMAGNAIHDLRSALDIAWIGAIPAENVSSHTKFPVDPEGSREKLDSTLTKKAKVPFPVPVLSLALDGVKPYHGGDADILALHILDIDDKHRSLIPMVALVNINGVELENEDGTIDRLDIRVTRPNFYRKTVAFGAKLKNHGEVAIQVTFREGTPTQGQEIVQVLRRFSVKVEEIVLRLRSMA